MESVQLNQFLNNMERLSEHFTRFEFEKSQSAKRLGIPNKMNAEQLDNAKALCENILEPLRKHINCPVIISSGFRSKELNSAIKGSQKSQHSKGEAVDIDMEGFYGITNYDIFKFLLHNTDFDQLIWEFGDNNNPDWIHISYSKSKTKQRNEVLRAVRTANGTEYHKYI